MKKCFLLLLIIFVFLFKINTVEALTRSTYDVNMLIIDGNYLKINGWAFITKNQANVHNINPIYTIQLVGVKNDNKTEVRLDKYIYNDSGDKPSYSEDVPADEAPYDYTKAYYNKGTYQYPDLESTGERAKAMLNALGSNEPLLKANRFAINLHFSIKIPFSDIVEFAKETGVKKLYMELTSKLDYPSNNKIRVYGTSFDVTNENGHYDKMKLAILKDRIIDIREKLAEHGVQGSLKGGVNEVTVVATYGQGRPGYLHPGFGWGINLDDEKYYYTTKNLTPIFPGKKGSGLPTYYFNSNTHGEKNATYGVTGEGVVFFRAIKSADYTVHAYETSISKKASQCSAFGQCLKYEANSDLRAWIPAFWIAPLKDAYTWIEIDGPNTEPTPPIPPVIVDPCEGLTGRDLYCCKNGKDDPLCKQDICEDRPEEGYYCKDEEPDSTNKNGTCLEDEDGLSIDFRYPSDGDHHTVLTNDACTISCQENMKLTFQPSQFVRAGMGYTYPVGVNGARTCIAAYSNQTWRDTLRAATLAAEAAYEQMETYLASANTKAASCGTKTDSLPISGLSYIVPAYKETGVCYENGCGVCVNCTTPICNPNPCGPNHDYLGNYNVYALNNTNENSYTTAKNVSNCSYKNNPLGLATLNFLNRNINTYLVENTEEEEQEDPCKDITPSPCPAPPTIECSAVYCTVYSCSGNKRYWDDAQTDIKSDLDKANEAKTEYERQKAIIDSLNNDRQTCDNWVTQNEYLKESTIDMKIDGETINDQSSYSRVGNGIYANSTEKSIKSDYDITYCNYGSHGATVSDILFDTDIFDNGEYCLSTFVKSEDLYDYWVARSTRQSTYQFDKQYYVQDYTGTPSLTGGSDYKADGNKEYTEFNAKSNYYNFTLNLRNVGPNLPKTSNSTWSIDSYECGYDLRNKIFPPDGDRYNDGDEDNGEYGSMAFMYRQISLNDPFPDRPPRWNWMIYWGYGSSPGIKNQAVENMKSQKNKIYGEEPKYVLKMTQEAMLRIANYNRNTPYSSSPYNSNFFSQNNFSDILPVRGDIK